MEKEKQFTAREIALLIKNGENKLYATDSDAGLIEEYASYMTSKSRERIEELERENSKLKMNIKRLQPRKLVDED